MLNRLLASIAIVSLLAALAVAVLWWRAGHGHTDTFHLGAASSTQVYVYTRPGSLAVEDRRVVGGTIRSRMQFHQFREVLGWCFVAPALWAAVVVRRRLLPRRPDLAPSALPRRR